MSKYSFKYQYGGDDDSNNDDFINQYIDNLLQNQSTDDNSQQDNDDDDFENTYISNLLEDADDDNTDEPDIEQIIDQKLSQLQQAQQNSQILGNIDLWSKAFDPNDQEVQYVPGGGAVVNAQATSYGYSNDPYADTNSLNGIGNHNNKLSPNSSVALSKETAAKLGVSSGDKIQVKLPNGQSTVVSYDDTVPSNYKNDRIDFYTPSGPVSFDGSQVQLQKIS